VLGRDGTVGEDAAQLAGLVDEALGLEQLVLQRVERAGLVGSSDVRGQAGELDGVAEVAA
jgi:hypothetical protein